VRQRQEEHRLGQRRDEHEAVERVAQRPLVGVPEPVAERPSSPTQRLS
jgi:hypothetical protein